MSVVLSRMTKTATLRARTSSGTDEYGNPTEVEATSSSKCHVRPLSTDELPDGISSERWKIYLPAGTALDVDDRVSVDGELYEVVSVPTERYNPRSRMVEAITAEIERRS